MEVFQLTPSVGWEKVDRPLAVEEPLQICLDGEPYATLMRTPGSGSSGSKTHGSPTPGLDKELALGFCFTEGLIDGLSQIRLLEHCGSGHTSSNVVNLRLAYPPRIPITKRNLEVRSGCSLCGVADIEYLSDQLTPIVDAGPKFAPPELLELPARMEKRQALYAQTGTTHAAALFTSSGELLFCAEDIGRHNALDKVIGWSLLHRVELKDKVALLSSRATFEMIIKSLRAQLPFVAAISGVSRLAVELSRRMGGTLVGFLRHGGMRVFSGSRRVAGAPITGS